MRHKLIYGGVGVVIAGTAVAVPLAVTLTQKQESFSAEEQALRDKINNAKVNEEDSWNAMQDAKKEVVRSRYEAELKQAELDKEVDRLASEKDAIAIEAQTAREELRAKEEELRLLEQQANEAQTRVDQAERDYQARVDELARQANAQALEAQARESELAQREEELAQQQELLQQKNEEVASAYNALGIAQAELDDMKLNGAPADVIAAKEQQVRDLQQKITDLEAEQKTYEISTAQAESAKNTALTQLDQARRELETKDSQITQLGQNIQTEQGLLTSAVASRNQAQRERDAQKSTFDQKTNELAQKNAQIIDLTNARNEANRLANEAEQRMKEQEARVVLAQQQAALYQDMLNALRDPSSIRTSTPFWLAYGVNAAVPNYLTNEDYFKYLKELLDKSRDKGVELDLLTMNSLPSTYPTNSQLPIFTDNYVPGQETNGLPKQNSTGTNVNDGYTLNNVFFPTSGPLNPSNYFDAKMMVVSGKDTRASHPIGMPKGVNNFFTSMDFSRNSSLEYLKFEDEVGVKMLPQSPGGSNAARSVDYSPEGLISLDLSYNTNLKKIQFSKGYYLDQLNFARNKSLDYLGIIDLRHPLDDRGQEATNKFAIDKIDISNLPNFNSYSPTRFKDDLGRYVAGYNNNEKGLKIIPHIKAGANLGDSYYKMPMINTIKIREDQVPMILSMFQYGIPQWADDMYGVNTDRANENKVAIAQILRFTNFEVVYNDGTIHACRVYPYDKDQSNQNAFMTTDMYYKPWIEDRGGLYQTLSSGNNGDLLTKALNWEWTWAMGEDLPGTSLTRTSASWGGYDEVIAVKSSPFLTGVAGKPAFVQAPPLPTN